MLSIVFKWHLHLESIYLLLSKQDIVTDCSNFMLIGSLAVTGCFFCCHFEILLYWQKVTLFLHFSIMHKHSLCDNSLNIFSVAANLQKILDNPDQKGLVFALVSCEKRFLIIIVFLSSLHWALN